jgi:hypothetical protein
MISPSHPPTGEIPEGFLAMDGDFGPPTPFFAFPIIRQKEEEIRSLSPGHTARSKPHNPHQRFHMHSPINHQGSNPSTLKSSMTRPVWSESK